MSTFQDYSIPPSILERLAALDFISPTDVQEAAIPPQLEGKDCIVQSHTGTGKTLAYLLPILSRLDPENRSVQAMVIAPSQELAIQIIEEIRKLTVGSQLVGQQLIGGANVRHQIERLKKHPQIVVGTPGRLMDLITSGKLKISGLRYLVIDEVDHVLAFKDDLAKIKKSLPRDRQTVFVSATISPSAQDEAIHWMREPYHIQVKGVTSLPDTIEHSYILCDARDKIDVLRRLVHASQGKSIIAFLNDGYRIEEVFSKLSFKGITVTALVGEVTKEARAAALKAFRMGESNVLLTTELGARGLDIKGVSHVFNLGLPTDADHYLHRAGRCGRLGKPGVVVSLATPNERYVIEKFASALGITISQVEMAYGKIKKINASNPRVGRDVNADTAKEV